MEDILYAILGLRAEASEKADRSAGRILDRIIGLLMPDAPAGQQENTETAS